MHQNNQSILNSLIIEWDPSTHHVGHTLIDEQHQEIVTIANIMAEMVLQNPDSNDDYFLHQLHKFDQILTWHLRIEEALLVRHIIGSKQLDQHNHGHNKLEQYVQSILESFHCKPNPVKCVIQILQYVHHHIFIDDFSLADDFRLMQQGSFNAVNHAGGQLAQRV